MKNRTKLLLVGAVVVAVATGGTGIAVATRGDDDHTPPISGPALDRARAAALSHTGGGRVTGTETGDEESAYEVEVTKADGTKVDVQLDRSFQVLGDEADGRGERDD